MRNLYPRLTGTHKALSKNQILTFTSSYIQETNRNIKQNPPIKRSECHKCNLRNETILDLPLHRLQKPIKSYNIRGLRFSTRSQKISIDIIANSNIFLKVYYLALAYKGLFVKFMLQNILIDNQRPRAAIHHCSKVLVLEKLLKNVFYKTFKQQFKILYLLSEHKYEMHDIVKRRFK